MPLQVLNKFVIYSNIFSFGLRAGFKLAGKNFAANRIAFNEHFTFFCECLILFVVPFLCLFYRNWYINFALPISGKNALRNYHFICRRLPRRFVYHALFYVHCIFTHFCKPRSEIQVAWNGHQARIASLTAWITTLILWLVKRCDSFVCHSELHCLARPSQLAYHRQKAIFCFTKLIQNCALLHELQIGSVCNWSKHTLLFQSRKLNPQSFQIRPLVPIQIKGQARPPPHCLYGTVLSFCNLRTSVLCCHKCNAGSLKQINWKTYFAAV